MRFHLLTLLAAATTSNALVLHPARPHRPVFSPAAKPAAATALHGLRGGTVRASAVSGALAGAWAIPAATGIAAVAGSLAYIRQAYIFSLSYGLAMLGIGGAVLSCAPLSPLLLAHASLVTAYGARLFAFLFWRQKFQPSYDAEGRLAPLEKTPRPQRTPIILSTAIFYGLMAAPLLFHYQSAPFAVGVASAVSAAGSALAAVGLLYEAVADQQKSIFKAALRADGKPDALFTGGLYSTSRHPNYLGEMAFWLGSFVAGAPALVAPGVPLLSRALRLVASGLGLAGIFFIMLSATKRLEGKQAQKWRPSAAFDKYYLSTNALLPKLI